MLSEIQVKAVFCKGNVMEDTDKDNKKLGTFHTYINFQQANFEKNQMEDFLTVYDGRFSEDLNLKGTLIVGKSYLLTCEIELSNKKDSTVRRHKLLKVSEIKE